MLKHVRLSTAMTLSLVTPVIAVVVDSFFERAVTMSSETYAGILIVLAGVAISILLRDKKSGLSSSNES
jgi:drug/metabolite transporter (DMT)-like permease